MFSLIYGDWSFSTKQISHFKLVILLQPSTVSQDIVYISRPVAQQKYVEFSQIFNIWKDMEASD